MTSKTSEEVEQVKEMIKTSQKLRRDSMRLAKTQRKLVDKLEQAIKALDALERLRIAAQIYSAVKSARS